jgi:predicted nucleotidyltransferase
MRDIKAAILEHIEEAKSFLRNENSDADIFGVFLYGSQNYGMADEKSDVDTKCMLVPSIREMCLRKPVSFEAVLDNKEHCNIKDIRLAIKELRKVNHNNVQILYTDYFWVNPKYTDLWEELIAKRDEIAYGDVSTSILATTHEIVKKLESNDPKRLATAIRLDYVNDRYTEGYNYADCVKIPEKLPSGLTKSELLELKRCKTPDYMAEEKFRSVIANLKDKYSDIESMRVPRDEAKVKIMNDILDDFLIKVISRKCM